MDLAAVTFGARQAESGLGLRPVDDVRHAQRLDALHRIEGRDAHVLVREGFAAAVEFNQEAMVLRQPLSSSRMPAASFMSNIGLPYISQ